MHSIREVEGYVRIDHRESPGLDHPMLGKGTFFEAPTYNCPYCGVTVILNPKRSREREFCHSTGRFICDRCGALRKAGKTLKPFVQVIDEFLRVASNGGDADAYIKQATKGMIHGT